MDGKQVKEVLGTSDDVKAEQVLTTISSAIQTANLDYPEMVDGLQWNQHVKTNEESRHLTRAILQCLHTNGYEIRPKSAI
jgi:hypothetical protein